MLLRQGVKTALPKTQKQTQEGCQIEETKKYGPNERTENPRKRTKWNKDNHLSDAEFKTLVIRMLKELTDYCNNIKEEMKVTLSEIKKKIYRESPLKEVRIQTDDLEHK